MEIGSCVTYELDAADRLIGVGGAWGRFARENEGESCLDHRVVGRPLWDFVRDQALRTVYEGIFRTVRERGGPLSFPFRCDAPHEKRFMRMDVCSRPRRGLLVESTLVRTEPRRPPLRVSGAVPGAVLLKRCSVCLAFGIGEAWKSLEGHIADGLLERDDRAIRAVYAVCPGCRADLEAVAAR